MGKRGPAPTPTELKLVRGVRSDRVNKAEPLPDREVRRPGWLRPEAVEVWDRLAPDLEAKKVLTAWDVDALADFCELVVVNREAFADLAANGTRITVVVRELLDGTAVYGVTKNPNWQIAKESAALMVTIGGRFGLNPSDRAQLSTGGGKTDAEAGRDLLSG